MSLRDLLCDLYVTCTCECYFVPFFQKETLAQALVKQEQDQRLRTEQRLTNVLTENEAFKAQLAHLRSNMTVTEKADEETQEKLQVIKKEMMMMRMKMMPEVVEMMVLSMMMAMTTMMNMMRTPVRWR